MSQEIHSEELPAGGRKYFFDVRRTEGGNTYVHIKEKKFVEGGREEHEIVVFAEHIDQFAETLEKVRQYLKNNPSE
jgi:hypothetical protein